MLIATFGPSAGWSGRTITLESEVFTLQDHGPISAVDVLNYDRQDHLVWADDGMRAWVLSKATASAAPTAGFTGLEGFERHSSTDAADSKPSGLKTPWGVLTPLTIIGLLVVIISLVVVVNGIIGGILLAVIGGVILVVAYSRGELDDWVKRGSAAGGHMSLADPQRSPAGTGASQSTVSTPLTLLTPALASVAPATSVAQHAPMAQPARVDSPPTSIADEIAKLAELHSKGSITDEEFAAYKAKLMG